VVSAHKMNKSIMVAVPILRHFPKYKRWVFKTSKLMVHDEKEICDVGDKVRIQQTSKFTDNKSHRVAEIIRKEPGSGFVNQHPEYMITREATREKERMDAKGVKDYKEWYTLPNDMEEEKKRREHMEQRRLKSYAVNMNRELNQAIIKLHRSINLEQQAKRRLERNATNLEKVIPNKPDADHREELTNICKRMREQAGLHKESIATKEAKIPAKSAELKELISKYGHLLKKKEKKTVQTFVE